MAHRIAPRAEADLDYIWVYVARESGSLEIATRLIDSISDRFYFLSSFPWAGRARDEDFGSGSRSFGVGEYVIVYRVEDADVFVLRVVHGKRELDALFDR
jgi:toxin ParE1/3/4